MGYVNVKVGLTSILDPSLRRDIELLVDTGALYSIVPATLLRTLGVLPQERMQFELADGRTIDREVGQVSFHFNGRHRISTVIFGEEGDASVLGVVTLEEMGLEVDVSRRQIRPMRKVIY